MLSIYDLNNQVMLKDSDFFSLTNGFDTFSGVSFVGSFKILEKELLPRFKNIKLILGMEDQKTGQSLNQLFDISRRVKEIKNASDEFMKRISDGTLQLHFTKDHLFHSKYFILENENKFAIFNGSMNLTNKAIHDNYEMLWLYRGDKNNSADFSIYKDHKNLFKHNFTFDSTEYIDRKIIKQLGSKTTYAEITAVVTNDVIDKLGDKTVVVSPSAVKQLVRSKIDDESNLLMKPETVEILKNTYTQNGNLKRNLDQVKSSIKKVTYQTLNKTVTKEMKASDLYPKPMWAYDHDQIMVKDDGNELFHPLTINSDLVTRDDVETFIDIIRSFKLNKEHDESHQALSAFLYLMTAPLIWKIREEVYQKSNFAKNPDQVPMSMVLIGRGSTGKTLLLSKYFKPFVGDCSKTIQYTEINGSNARPIPAINFLSNYLKSKRFISPMIVDELNGNFLSYKDAIQAIKDWSSLRIVNGVHNVNIFAMNHNKGDKPINNLEEITKRTYYLSFTSDWKLDNQQEIPYKILINNVNDHIYRYVTWHLNERLNHLNGNEESHLIDDYLYLTKDILYNLLDKFGQAEKLPSQIWENYDYKRDCNKTNWRMLIQNDNFEHVSFIEGKDNVFNVAKSIFNSFKGTSYENINESLDNYYNMFPRKEGIALELYDSGMLLDIDRFDEFIGEPLIRNYYNKIHSNERQQIQLETLLEQQNKQNEILVQTMSKLASSQNQPVKKKGFWSRLFDK